MDVNGHLHPATEYSLTTDWTRLQSKPNLCPRLCILMHIFVMPTTYFGTIIVPSSRRSNGLGYHPTSKVVCYNMKHTALHVTCNHSFRRWSSQWLHEGYQSPVSIVQLKFIKKDHLQYIKALIKMFLKKLEFEFCVPMQLIHLVQNDLFSYFSCIEYDEYTVNISSAVADCVCSYPVFYQQRFIMLQEYFCCGTRSG